MLQCMAATFLAYLMEIIGEGHMVDPPDPTVLSRRQNATNMRIPTILLSDLPASGVKAELTEEQPASGAGASSCSGRTTLSAAVPAAPTAPAAPAAPARPPMPTREPPQVTRQLPPEKQAAALRDATEAVSSLTGQSAANLTEAWL